MATYSAVIPIHKDLPQIIPTNCCMIKAQSLAPFLCVKLLEFIYLRTLFELKTKFSSPAMVEFNRPAAQPLLSARVAARAGSPVTRLPSICFSNSGSPHAFLSFLLFLSSSRSFLSQLSTVLCRYNSRSTNRNKGSGKALLSLALSLSYNLIFERNSYWISTSNVKVRIKKNYH